MKMGFGSDLKNSHDALLKLQDWELRLLETVKKFMALRIKSDKEYASTLQNLCNQIDKESTAHMNYVSNVSQMCEYIYGRKLRSREASKKVAKKQKEKTDESH
uniref:FER tyrosine kinase n=1 Tax=Sarcophilus harrisii TaxID=9305 RepID=A0A7N4P332_SARHA